MSYGFHKHTRLYVDAIQRAGFVSFSFANEKLIDELIRELSFNRTWDRLNYMFIAATDSTTGDIGKINLRQPTRILPWSGTPLYTIKKGISGNINTGFEPVAHTRINLDPGDVSFWAYCVEGGIASVPAIENFSQYTTGTIFQIIRARVNPSMDCIINTTVANPVTIVTGAPQDNTLYFVEYGNPGAGITRSLLTNKVVRSNVLSGGGAGTIPSSGSVSYGSGVDASRMIGGIGGGGQIYNAGLHSNTGGFADTIKKYFDAVQLLP